MTPATLIWTGQRQMRHHARVTTIDLTLIGGPTALIEIEGIRLLTDPTFDAPGEYVLPHVTLRKTMAPAISAAAVGSVDAVLLSHDQHADNLDHAGRAYVLSATRVFTTVAAAGRLGGPTVGLRPWDETTIVRGDASLALTATPARHGPAGIEPLAGDVIGFVVRSANACVYVTGDTVWFDGVAAVVRRFTPDVVLLFAGAARTRGPFHLTMDTNDAIEMADACRRAVIVPVHYDSWQHFSQGREDLERSFSALGIASRLRVLEPGIRAPIEIHR